MYSAPLLRHYGYKLTESTLSDYKVRFCNNNGRLGPLGKNMEVGWSALARGPDHKIISNFSSGDSSFSLDFSPTFVLLFPHTPTPTKEKALCPNNPQSLPALGEESKDGFFHRSSIGSVSEKAEGLFEFYAINECQQERCPIFMHCRHLKTERQCQIQIKYLKAISEMIFNGISIESLSQVQKLKIGFHLQPLYRALCRLKMEELSLRRPTQMNKAGSRVVHPVYKEIRETIKTLTVILRDLGLDDKKLGDEEKNFYDSLFDEGEKPQLTKRRGRK